MRENSIRGRAFALFVGQAAGWIVLWLLGRGGNAVLPQQSRWLAVGIAGGLAVAFLSSIADAMRNPKRWRMLATGMVILFLVLIGLRLGIVSLLVGAGGLAGFLWGDGITRGTATCNTGREDASTAR